MSQSIRLPTAEEAASGWARVVTVLRTHVSLVLLLALGAGLFSLAVAGVDEVYESVLDDEDIASVDQPLLDAAVAQRNPGLDAAVTVYTDLGGVVWAPVITAVVVVVMAVVWRSWTPVVLMVAATAGSLAMTSVGKTVVGRERPDTALAVPPFETSPAFPSGHALNATVIAGVLAYLVVLRLRSTALRILTVLLAVVHAVLMGLSRVYLGHHWFTDVVVAWCLGVGWLVLVVALHQVLLRRVGHDDPQRGAELTAAT